VQVVAWGGWESSKKSGANERRKKRSRPAVHSPSPSSEDERDLPKWSAFRQCEIFNLTCGPALFSDSRDCAALVADPATSGHREFPLGSIGAAFEHIQDAAGGQFHVVVSSCWLEGIAIFTANRGQFVCQSGRAHKKKNPDLVKGRRPPGVVRSFASLPEAVDFAATILPGAALASPLNGPQPIELEEVNEEDQEPIPQESIAELCVRRGFKFYLGTDHAGLGLAQEDVRRFA
jgi:hypothetical protein